MGKGDIKTRRGKIVKGSYGKKRLGKLAKKKNKQATTNKAAEKQG